MAISLDGRMYVANTGSSTVSVINTATGQRVDANTSIFSTDIKVGSKPGALTLSPDGKQLYVANTGSNTVSVINTDTYKMIDTNTSALGTQSISVGSTPSAMALSLDGKRLYVANRGSNKVSVIDTDTYKLVDINSNVSGFQSITVGSSPNALALGPDGRLYVANTGSGTVSVINTSSYSVTNTITVGSQPSGVAMGADGRLYVTNTGSGTVSVINTATDTLIDTNPNALGINPISVGSSPSSVALSPDGSLAYVANGDDTVSVIDTQNYTVLSTVPIDTDTSGGHVIAVSPNGTIYVTDAADRTVRVLTTAESSGISAIGSVTLTGDRPGSLVVSADGTRALLITAYPRGRVTVASYPDGIRGSTTRVAVIDTASGRQVGTTFTVTGSHGAGVQLSADGTRALISAYDTTGTHVAMLNTTTGTEVGTTFTLSGYGSVQFIAHDSRALITANAYSASTGTTTRVAVLNTSTGAQSGTTLTINGSISEPLFNADRSRVLITTSATDGNTRVAVLNTTAGTQIGSTLTLTGGFSSLPVLSTDGTRALITTDANSGTTRVTVLNTTTGTQIGTTLTVTGDGYAVFNPGSSRAVITTLTYDSPPTYTNLLAVLDTTTGTQIGTTLAFGFVDPSDSPVFNPDGTRALITGIGTDAAGANTSLVTTIDTVTGTQTGATLTLTGNPFYGFPPVFSPDGTRALIATDAYDSATTSHTSRVTMINTSTGAQTGTTLTVTGPNHVDAMWRADGTRALITMTPTVYDSFSSPMLVAVVDATGTQVGATVTIDGMPTYGARPFWSPDGTHVVITTNTYTFGAPQTTAYTTTVTTINTTTGTQTGTTLTLVSGAGGASLTPNGKRATVIAGDQVAVINTTTGTQIGTTLTVNGTPSAPLFSTDGSRALITTASAATVIDLTTGSQIGSTLTLTAPRPIGAILCADGTHALLTTGFRGWGYPAIPATPIAVIDLATGNQIGTTLSLVGDTYASPAFTLNDTRALISTVVDDPTTGESTTRVMTINTATGMPTGNTVTLSGVLSSTVNYGLQVLLSPDGTRALVATTSTPDFRTSQVAMINTATGTQIGNTVTINGALSGLRWSTDGTRVFVTTYITTTRGGDLSVQETVLKTV